MKNRRRQQRKMPPIRRLFETCREVFADGGTDFVPLSEDVERLRAVLDDLRPEDLGLTVDMLYFQRMMVNGPQTISYLHLYIGIFCLPPSGVIPLHNHAGMTVFSRPVDLVERKPGQHRIKKKKKKKSYDLVVDDPSQTSAGSTPISPPGARLAKVKVDSEFTAPCNTSILYPADGGNMHRFTVVTACAVLNVLGPPYSDAEGRHCTYYRDFPLASLSVNGILVAKEDKGGYARLEEMKKPEDFTVVGAMYRDPRMTKK